MQRAFLLSVVGTGLAMLLVSVPPSVRQRGGRVDSPTSDNRQLISSAQQRHSGGRAAAPESANSPGGPGFWSWARRHDPLRVARAGRGPAGPAGRGAWRTSGLVQMRPKDDRPRRRGGWGHRHQAYPGQLPSRRHGGQNHTGGKGRRPSKLPDGEWAPTGPFGPGPYWDNKAPNGRTGVFFLSRAGSQQLSRFAERVGALPGYDAFVVTDGQTAKGAMAQGIDDLELQRMKGVTYVKSGRANPWNAGFSHWHEMAYRQKGSTVRKDGIRVLAADKAMFFIAKALPDPGYSRFWIVEDDVFIPSEYGFLHIDHRFPSAEFLTRYVEAETEASKWHHWEAAAILPQPRYRAHASAVRVSARLMQAVFFFVKLHGRMAFSETMFATLAKQRGLQINTPRQFKLFCCNAEPPTFASVKGLPGYWWHRMKNRTMHEDYRQRLSRLANHKKYFRPPLS